VLVKVLTYKQRQCFVSVNVQADTVLVSVLMYKQRQCYSNYQCKCRDGASVSVNVQAETVLE